MLPFTEQEILTITGGVPVGVPAEKDGFRSAGSISTDTRTIEAGALFVALVGERFDGHSFCRTAYEKGASLFLISDEHMLPDEAAGILVPDTLTALHALARAYRRKLGCVVIAVTGSVGKTSTREMLYAALSGSRRTHATKQNLNNEIGLPMTILSAPADTELLIVEMGMRMSGEIRILTHIAEPDIAIITNIGVSHIERLGSQEEILAAKMEICEGLTGRKILLINGDDRHLVESVHSANPIIWNQLGVTCIENIDPVRLHPDLTVSASDISPKNEGTDFSALARFMESESAIGLGEFLLPCIGIHHVKNALFSLACALCLDIDMENVKKGLLSFIPTGSRGRMVQTRLGLLYDDSYNASTESMKAAFESIRIIAGHRRKIAALGGMLELGTFAPEQHFLVGAAAAAAGFDELYVCGDNRTDVMAGAASVSPELPVHLFENRDALTAALLPAIHENDVILIKGSHSFEMEKVTQAIMDTCKN